MKTKSEPRRWGIEVLLPAGDPMSAPHLLGEDWQSTRWYLTEMERDAALADMQDQPAWYRKGDVPSVRLSRIDPS